MTIERQIRESVARTGEQFDSARLVGIEQIVATATVRRRRNRLGALGVCILICLASIGIGASLFDTKPTNVVASEADGAFPDNDLVVWQAVWVDGRFVGLATDGQYAPDELGNERYAVVASSDGTDWMHPNGALTFEASSLAITEHAGIFHIVAAQSIASDDAARELTQVVTVRSSADLVQWDERPQSLSAEIVPAGHGALIEAAVAGNAGLLVQAKVVPMVTTAFAFQLEELGYDVDTLCEYTGTASRATFRVCGTVEEIMVDFDFDSRRSELYEEVFLFAPVGGLLDLTVLPSIETGTAPQLTIYATNDGFGVAGLSVYESIDGEDWTEIRTREDDSVMVAARGAERVYRSSFPVQRFGPDDPMWGIAYRSGGGDWAAVDLDPLYDRGVTRPRWFTGLRAGAAGWTLVAQRSVDQVPDESVERDNSGESDFILTSETGYVLSGHTPFGPATLVDHAGLVVHEWEQLEVSNPAWSGFAVDKSGVILVDDETGDEVVRFTTEQWSAVLDPRDLLAGIEYDVLFSANGMDWELVWTSSAMPTVLAMSDDRLVVREFHLLGHVFHEAELVAIPVG